MTAPLAFPLLALALATPSDPLACESAPSTPATVLDGVGLNRVEEGLFGAGPRYRLHLEAGRVVYTPTLGPTAPRTRPLSLAFREARRGGVLVHAAGPRIDAVESGMAAEYRHTPTFVERYEMTRSGVELSFVFAELPPVDGDLVVALELATDLALVSADPLEGLAFEAAGLGGVTIGGVTGIDAAGWSARGWIELVGGRLELGLPAEFVAQAELPLVLDPLIGTTIDVDVTSADDRNPDVSHHPVDSSYLVVWARHHAADDVDVMGQIVGIDGMLNGGLLTIAPSGINRRPAAGALTDVTTPSLHFAVAWEHRDDAGDDSSIRLALVDPPTGAVSIKIVVADVAGVDDRRPDVSLSAPFVHVVWDQVDGGLEWARVGGSSGGVPYVDATQTLSSDLTAAAPKLAKDFSAQGWVHCAWTEEQGELTQVRALRWEGDSAPPSAGHLLYQTDRALSSLDIAVAHHRDALLVWDEHQEGASPIDRDILGLRLRYAIESSPVADAPIDIAAFPTTDEYSPAVSYARNGFVVTYLEEFGESVHLHSWAVDAMTGETADWQLLAAADSVARPASAGNADFSPDSATAGVLAVWADNVVGPLDGDVHAQRLRGVGGTHQEFPATGCSGLGPVGWSRVSSATAGSAAFQFELWDAPTGTLTLQMVSPLPMFLPVGGAALVPHVLGSVVLGSSTDFDGYSKVTAPIPEGLAGFTVWSQWVVLPAGWPACSGLGVDLAHGVAIEIE